MKSVLKILSDLRITIVLLSLSMVMIFFGTLDQTNIGIKGTLDKYFEGYFHAWEYPKEWPMGTRMVFALHPDDPKAGQKLSLSDLKDYAKVGFNDNTFFEQSNNIYKKADMVGPTHKFQDLATIKSQLQEGDGNLKRVAILPDDAIKEEINKKTLAFSTIKGEPGFSLSFIRVPVLGGYVIGPLLFINLMAAFCVRYQFTMKKAGVLIIHSGLILMLVSELVTDLTDRESLMTIEEGETSYYSTDFDKNEIILLDRSQPNVDTALSVPVSLLEKKKKRDIDLASIDSGFPFQLKFLEFFPNTQMDIREEEGAEGHPFKVGDRTVHVVAKEVPKTFDPQKINFVSALVEVQAGENTYGPFFISNRLEFFEDHRRHTFEHEGKEYAIALRRTRYYYDYGVRLDDFRFLKYPGTEKPKDFTSDVTLLLPDGSTEPKRIFMNHPLIHDNSTFFQSGWNEETERGTRLQVVQNPGKHLPYYGVAIVGLGLCVQFAMHLGNFTKRRARQQKKEEAAA